MHNLPAEEKKTTKAQRPPLALPSPLLRRIFLALTTSRQQATRFLNRSVSAVSSTFFYNAAIAIPAKATQFAALWCFWSFSGGDGALDVCIAANFRAAVEAGIAIELFVQFLWRFVSFVLNLTKAPDERVALHLTLSCTTVFHQINPRLRQLATSIEFVRGDDFPYPLANYFDTARLINIVLLDVDPPENDSCGWRVMQELGQLPLLQHVSVLGDSAQSWYLAPLWKSQSLRSITLSDTKLSRMNIECIAALPQLSTLHLKFLHIDFLAVELLRTFPKLNDLSLLQVRRFNPILSAVPKTIQKLSLTLCFVDSHQLHCIGAFAQLTCLCLDNCEGAARIDSELAEVVGQLTYLEVLRLAQLSVGPSTFHSIVTRLKSLTCLSLLGCDLFFVSDVISSNCDGPLPWEILEISSGAVDSYDFLVYLPSLWCLAASDVSAKKNNLLKMLCSMRAPLQELFIDSSDIAQGKEKEVRATDISLHFSATLQFFSYDGVVEHIDRGSEFIKLSPFESGRGMRILYPGLFL